MSEIVVSVIIPTYNGGSLFEEVMDKVLKQKLKDGKQFEVICIDSQSSDGTYEYLVKKSQEDNRLKVYQIDKKTFQHGRTRNLGASYGTGTYIAFMTQDAMPYDENWLQELINPFSLDEEIVGSYSKHLPYDDCDIFEKELLNQFFLSFGEDTTIYYIEDQEKYDNDDAYRSKLCFYSDNASAMRRSIWEVIPYPEVEFGEDQKWARLIIEKGYKKAYAAHSVIYHSHSYNFKQFYARYKEEGKSLYLIYHVKLVEGYLDLAKKLPYHILNDFKYLLGKYRAKQLKLKDVLYWSYFSIGKNTARYFGLLDGVKEGVRQDG